MNPFWELKQKRGTLLASHRGVNGGNIPCNSLQAFQLALNMGADIVELDVEQTLDGRLFIQHPTMERVHLRFKDSLREYPESFVKEMYLSNNDMNKTQYHIARFEEALDLLKGKCFINVDKFWGAPEAISRLIRERGMEDQVLVKTKLEAMDLNAIETYAKGLHFMPVCKSEDNALEIFKNSSVNYVGSEVLFETDDLPVASPEYIEKMHDAGKIIWVNPIVYNYKKVLVGTHTDDNSMLYGPDTGWGWLAERGFDVLQTDWLRECDTYLKSKGYRK